MTLDRFTTTFPGRVSGLTVSLRWAVATVLCGLLLSFTSQAQLGLGGISGTILDNGGAAIPGATVTVTNSGTQGKRVQPPTKTESIGWTAFRSEPIAWK